MSWKAYYNEHDPKAAAWLRGLINAGLIMGGVVDERSIADVSPDDLAGFQRVHFFAGIGGWDYALQLSGWPDDRPVWTGSCPCQPFSAAGKGLGTADARHLWPEFCRLIAQCQPATIFGEQVASKDGRAWQSGVRADLEALGYAVGCADLCAAGVGTELVQVRETWQVDGEEFVEELEYFATVGPPHIRQRLFWVADAQNSHGRTGTEIESDKSRCGRRILGVDCHACGIPDTNGDGCHQTGFGQSTAGNDGFVGIGGACRLEHSSSDGRKSRRTESDGRSIASGCGPDTHTHTHTHTNRRLVDSEQPGLEGHTGHEHDRDQSGRIDEDSPRSIAATGGGSWSDFTLVPCGDGKTRRLKSGLEPLAHGVPGRVGLLRGYGNAIVPQVAAEFIQAFCEIKSGV